MNLLNKTLKSNTSSELKYALILIFLVVTCSNDDHISKEVVV
jgi:hypothetical protein